MLRYTKVKEWGESKEGSGRGGRKERDIYVTIYKVCFVKLANAGEKK